MTALGHYYSVYYRKMLVRLWYMLNRTLKTNVEPWWPLKSNLELRWPPFVCHVIWAVFATRNARTFVRSEDSEPFVRRTSRMKKRAYERILTFGTAQSNTPSENPRGKFVVTRVITTTCDAASDTEILGSKSHLNLVAKLISVVSMKDV